MNPGEFIERAVKSCERTASLYAARANNSTGIENMIYAEICDALRILADELRTGVKAD